MLKFPVIYHILSAIPIIFALVTIFSLYIGVICLIASFVTNTAVYLATKRKIQTFIATAQYLSSLIWCCKKIRKIESLQSEPYVMQLTQLFEVFKPIMKKSSDIRQMTSDDFGVFYEYFKILRLSDIKSYNKVISSIAKHKEQFHALYKTLGEIDLSVCVLSFRESLPFCSTPIFCGENRIKFDEIYHPLLLSPISNSGIINNNSIITGSNASGKSTFIKTLAINGILAQTITRNAIKLLRYMDFDGKIIENAEFLADT